MIGNCLTFVLWRAVTRRGYVIFHRSPRGWWPHAVWSPDLVTFEQFLPIRHRRWYAWVLRRRIPPLLFDGHAVAWRKEENE